MRADYGKEEAQKTPKKAPRSEWEGKQLANTERERARDDDVGIRVEKRRENVDNKSTVAVQKELNEQKDVL